MDYSLCILFVLAAERINHDIALRLFVAILAVLSWIVLHALAAVNAAVRLCKKYGPGEVDYAKTLFSADCCMETSWDEQWTVRAFLLKCERVILDILKFLNEKMKKTTNEFDIFTACSTTTSATSVPTSRATNVPDEVPRPTTFNLEDDVVSVKNEDRVESVRNGEELCDIDEVPAVHNSSTGEQNKKVCLCDKICGLESLPSNVLSMDPVTLLYRMTPCVTFNSKVVSYRLPQIVQAKFTVGRRTFMAEAQTKQNAKWDAAKLAIKSLWQFDYYWI